MIQEYFHDDHSKSPRQIVILSSMNPSNDFEMLLKNPKYKNRLFYIEGKIREEYSMIRSKMHEAEAIFLIPDKNTKNQLTEDTDTVLTLFAIKKYLASKKVVILRV